MARVRALLEADGVQARRAVRDVYLRLRAECDIHGAHGAVLALDEAIDEAQREIDA